MDTKVRDKLRSLLANESSETLKKEDKSVFSDEDFERFVREYRVQ